jgi:Ran GTPase-activating protein (RanGAP) involved in mRNA processing and transport
MLKKNTSLTALELNNNSIDYEGTCAIAEALAENSTLEMLSISGNYVGSLGASALANGLINNSGIKGLMLNGNDIGNIGRSLCLLLLFSFACFSLNSRYHVTALCIIL